MHTPTKRLKLCRGLAFLIALGAVTSVCAQQTVVTISGRVTDQSTGQPIAGAAVSAQGNLTGTRVSITDAQGDYTLPLGANTDITLRAYTSLYAFNPLSTEFTSFGGPFTGTLSRNFTGNKLPFPILIFALPPIVLTEDSSLNTLAFDSMLYLRDPFALVNDNHLGTDKRTRLMLLLIDMDLYSGETISIITVQAQDAQQRTFVLPVEDLRKVPDFPWLSQLMVRLPPELAAVTDVTISVSARGQTSNLTKVRLY